MDNNKLIIAAAGSGKTSHLICEALRQKEKVLITTFTEQNEDEIKKKIIAINKFIPDNITIQTWFSFLLQHGVKPYQGYLFEKKIEGMILVSGKSGIKNPGKPVPIYYSEEKEFEKHYFTPTLKIFSDKISKFVVKCNKESNGLVIDRISKIYHNIFIDEVQDLAGYDLELLKLFFKSNSYLLLVGDPRQATYSTNNSSKNKQFKKSAIISFFEDRSLTIQTDSTSLVTNYRSPEAICKLSNKLFPQMIQTASGNKEVDNHKGVFLIKEEDSSWYLNMYNPIQLRDSVRTNVNEDFKVLTFGESKGLTFDRILIYPTKPFINWLKDNQSELAPTSRSKFYVALTRAKLSVGIVFNYSEDTEIDGTLKFKVTI